MLTIIDTLASYVPALVQRRLATDPAPIAAPVFERFPAVALFADISGFTPLAESLSQRGREGAETLSRLLNAYFGQLIDLIHAHGGDIVKFAGDALLALWKDEGRSAGVKNEEDSSVIRHPLSLATLRAAQCGLAMQRTIQNFETTEVRLSLRMGIGAGEVTIEHLGGASGLWELLVAGDLLAQAGAAQRRADPGQVVLSPEAQELAQDRGVGQLLPVGGIRLESIHHPLTIQPLPTFPIPPEADAALRAYVPAAILSRLVAGQTGWLAELRRVTVIFIHLPALSHTTPLEQAQSVIRTLQETLYYYEGSVDKLNVDEKGVSLVAAFGLPPLAHEDDVTRGVQAALAMQTELRKLGWDCALGVATGHAFCGSVGNERRREYTMIGDVVNLAARLMQAASPLPAEGASILCDAATYQVARRDMEFDPLPAITVKGKAEPIPVYRARGVVHKTGLVAAHAWGGSQTAIVGRTSERRLLSKQLGNMLRSRQSSHVIIEGEAGMGKSRLVEDLLQQAEALGVDSLVGAGDAIEQSTRYYYAWRPIFSQLLDVDTSNDSMARRQQALEQFGLEPEWISLAPLLNAVLPLELPDNEVTVQLTGEVRADNTRDLLLRLLQASAAQAPKLLVLEDTHWLDSASWALTWLVSQQVQPAMLVIATRPLTDPLPTEYSQLLKAPTAHRLRLDTLSPEETLALVCQRLGVAAVPAPVAALIREKAEGNPFFSEELAYALRDAGLIRIVDGECRIANGDLSGLNLPDTVQGVITSRIDRLAAPQQLTLKVASVIGRTFAFLTLRDVHPVESDKAQLADYLNVLEKLDLTPLDVPEPNLAYMFKHIITREVAYNLMLFAQRRRLHQAVAEWYERAHANELSSFYELLAYHWRTAEVTSKAVDYLEKAGEQALRNYANNEAIGFFSQALALDAEARPPADAAHGRDRYLRRARWELHLGEAFANATRHGEGRQHLEAGLALLGQPVPSSPVRAVVSLLGQVLRQVLHRLWPAHYVGRLSHTRDTLLEAARTYERLTEVYFFANETLLALYAAICSLNLAEAAGLSPELARGYATVGAITGFIPLRSLAEAYCRRALEAVQQVENVAAQAWVSLATGVYYAGLGDWTKARGLFDEVVTVSERLGDRRRWDDGVTNLVMVNYFQGEFVRGGELADDFYASASRRGDADNQAWALQEKAYCVLPLGKLEEVGACADQLQAIFAGDTQTMDELVKIDVYGLLAIARLRQGRRQPALAAAEQAARLVAQSSPTAYQALLGYASVAEVYLTLWEEEVKSQSLDNPTSAARGPNRKSQNRVAAQRACQGLHKFARVFPIGQPRAWLWQGRYEWLAGLPSKARQAWHQSLDAARQLAMPYEQGVAHAELGRHLRTDDPDRRRHLAGAREIFTRLGAADDLARLPEG